MAEELVRALLMQPEYVYSGPLERVWTGECWVYEVPEVYIQGQHLTALLEKDPAAFLAAYKYLLTADQLLPFLSHPDSSVRLQALEAGPGFPQLSRNRRYQKLQELIQAGEYFSEPAIQAREPELYGELVGRYRDPTEPMPSSLSEGILALADRAERARITRPEDKEISPEELEDNEDFLIRTLHEDYLATPNPAVDRSDDYRDWAIEGRDAEEKWFEAEEEENACTGDTGEQDF
jgi:hypothetical protein